MFLSIIRHNKQRLPENQCFLLLVRIYNQVLTKSLLQDMTYEGIVAQQSLITYHNNLLEKFLIKQTRHGILVYRKIGY